MNKFGRTNKVLNSNFTNPATNKTYVGFWIPPDNFGVQTNFYNCYQNKLSTFNVSEKINLTDYQKVLNVMKQIESSFKCNGVCDYGNFYFFVDVSQGPPTKTCKDTLENIFNNISLNIGIALGVTFIFIFLTVCQQYWFCFNLSPKRVGNNRGSDNRKSRNQDDEQSSDSLNATPNHHLQSQRTGLSSPRGGNFGPPQPRGSRSG